MSVPKGFRGGTDRTVSPGETVDRVRPFMPAMGITRIANITGLDCIGIPVVMVCHPTRGRWRSPRAKDLISTRRALRV